MSTEITNISPIVIGGGSRLGDWPLRGHEGIIEPYQEVINNNNGLNVVFYSPSYEVVASLSSGYGQGAKLEANLKFSKLGGLKTFSISMLRNMEVPIFTGMNVRFYYKNKPVAYGYIDKIPPSDQESSEVELTGVGYSAKLSDKNISKTYEDKTDEFIVKDIISTYALELGFNYNSSKVVCTGLNFPKVIWDDKSIEDIIMDIIKASNSDFQNIQFIYGVDEFGDFYFYGIKTNDITTNYFEGYNFQNPKSSDKSDKIINQISIFRTEETDGQAVEPVSIVKDQNSIDLNGLFDRKLIISDYMDDDIAESIANGIIADLSTVKKQVDINDLNIQEIIPFGFYNITNKKQSQRIVLSEFTSLSEWDTTSAPTVELNTDSNVFTGRINFKFPAGSNEIITKDFENIYSPKKLRLYVKQSIAGTYIVIGIDGTKGLYYSNLVTNSGTKVITDSDEAININKSRYVTTEEYYFENDIIGDWVPFDIDVSEFFSISKITIYRVSTLGIVLIDRLEVFTESYITNQLALEEISYKIGKTFFKADSASFGDSPETLTKDLKKLDETTNVSYNVFSKGA